MVKGIGQECNLCKIKKDFISYRAVHESGILHSAYCWRRRTKLEGSLVKAARWTTIILFSLFDRPMRSFLLCVYRS